ncbi:PAS domain S-box protein, partial [Candidatus Poribacteria bacterium]|nr:PAS domain S-box protein [Candidatus Poribacteria bacterium]
MESKHVIRISLKFKFIFITSVLVIMSGIIFSSYSYYKFNEFSVQELRKRGLSLTGEIADTSKDDVLNKHLDDFKEHFQRTGILITIGIILFGVFISVMFFNFIVSPLNKITDGAMKITSGNFSGVINVETHDELEILADAFNKMSLSIRNQIERSTNIIQSISDPLFIVDNNKHIVFFNNAIEELTGYSAKEAIDKRCDEIIKSNICYTGCLLSECLKTNSPIRNKEEIITNKSGRMITIITSGAIIKDSEGKPTGAIVIMRDISVERQLQVEQEKVLNSLRILTNEVQKAINKFNNASEKLLVLIKDQTDSMVKQAESIGDVSSTIKEMSATASQVSDRAAKVLDYARNVVETSESGKVAVNNVLLGMNNINEKVGLITKEILALSRKIQKIGKIT